MEAYYFDYTLLEIYPTDQLLSISTKPKTGASRIEQCSHWRIEEFLFNLAHFRAKTKTKLTLIRDDHFAYDTALVAEFTLHAMMEHLSQACKTFFLVISIKKTTIQGNKPLEVIKKF